MLDIERQLLGVKFSKDVDAALDSSADIPAKRKGLVAARHDAASDDIKRRGSAM